MLLQSLISIIGPLTSWEFVQPEPVPTICILRRMLRKPLSTFALPWNHYNPSKALPEELTFELLDGNEKKIGSLVYNKVNFLKGSELTTPWGKVEIAFKRSWKNGPTISLNERELVKFDVHMLKKNAVLTFSNNVTMIFVPRKGFKNDLEFFGDQGYFGIFQEKGELPESMPSKEPQLTKDEIKMLPKDQRPRSIVGRKYTQFRIKSSGVLPVKLEDVVAALVIFASFGCLVDEIPTG